MDDDCLGLPPCFAGLQALVPRVIRLGVTSTSTLAEPGATAATTTHLTGFLCDAAFRAYGTDSRCQDCNMRTSIQRLRAIRYTSHRAKMYLHTSSLELTFAGLRALDPRVVNVSIASTSAILIPSTTGSATTCSPVLLECATIRTHHNR